jgi:gamma-glutamyltranspeptidase/glutathione hydrolase
MVVSEHPLASQVGRDVLATGGNAVDAAIATGFALAVTYPSAGNIGGGGFMVIRFPDGTSTALDFRERAPMAAHPGMFVGPDGEYSYELHHGSHRAVGVPGTVAGFDKAHRLYGSLPWNRLVEPAVDLAADGFELSERVAAGLAYLVDAAKEREYHATVEVFSDDGAPYEEGQVFRQPELAATRERIRREGKDGFYRGETARLIAEEMRRGGGLITEEDLRRYSARERTPIRGTYRGYDVVSMPPPSSGGVGLVQMLNILEGYDLTSMGRGSTEYVHHLVEAMRRAYRDRARYLADQDHYDVPLHRLTSKAYAETLRATIEPDRAASSDPVDLEELAAATSRESPETTHYSVVDEEGLAVSVTYTLEQGFGSKITVPGGGFLLNNEMGDFNGRPGLTAEDGLIGTEPNLARPGQRMLSSMTPTILARDGELVAVVGTPGGRTIINTVLQVVLGLVDFGMPIQEAVDAPRLHHQWLPDRVTVEEAGADDRLLLGLEALGHHVEVRSSQGLAHSIMIDPRTGERVGAPDGRNPDATAAGTGAR